MIKSADESRFFAGSLTCVHPETVDFGSGQGRSLFATAGVAALRRGLRKGENTGLGRRMLFMDGHQLTLHLLSRIG